MIGQGWTGIVEVLGNLDKFSVETQKQIRELYQQAQEGTYSDSQAEVPVDSGDLKASGDKPSPRDSGSSFQYDVTYGGDGGQVYEYPVGAATTQYVVGDMGADGYAWFQELGTRKMASQPYLGHNFDNRVQGLLDALRGLF